MNAFRMRILGAALLCALIHAPAALAQGGVNFAWNDCAAEGGGANLDFGCDTDAGANLAVASFVLPVDAPQVVGIYAVVEIHGSESAPLSPWWELQAGGCRAGSLGYSTDFTGAPFDAATRCFDVWQNQAWGGLYYDFGYLGDPGRARFRMIAAVPGSQAKSLVAGREYYGFAMRVNNAKSTGVSGCGGCGAPVSLVLSLLQIAQPAGVGDFNLTVPVERNVVTWQRTERSGLTPATRRSWGQIKTLYR